jgi:dTDP-4-dehydrorhamnose 3,5-epimerase
MRYHATPIQGVYLIEQQRIEDARGYFAYLYEGKQHAANGLSTNLAQIKLSHNRRQGTLRGLHWQTAPSDECKLVRCIHGRIFDVCVDLRPGSATFLKHFTVELSRETGNALYVPAGCAHGFQTLDDNSDVMYLTDNFYDPTSERGLRYDDPVLSIRWPLPVRDISQRDRNWALLHPTQPVVPM